MTSAYLSIDLDYWCMATTGRGVSSTIARALALRVPTLVVRDHDALVEHADHHPADMLINVDAHDDIAVQSEATVLDAGDWVSFVAWRECATYEWRHPHENTLAVRHGMCFSTQNPWRNPPSLSGWKNLRIHQGLRGLPWRNVVALGISISPEYLEQPGDDLGIYRDVVAQLTGRKTIGGLFHFHSRRVRRRSAK